MSLILTIFSEHYKLIAIDVSKQKSDLKNLQINFIGKVEQNATIFFIIEDKKTTGFFDYCIKMESQKIINLLDHRDEDDPR